MLESLRDPKKNQDYSQILAGVVLEARQCWPGALKLCWMQNSEETVTKAL